MLPSPTHTYVDSIVEIVCFEENSASRSGQNLNMEGWLTTGQCPSHPSLP